MEDNYLEHHGIMGQKKGRRRYQNPDGSLTPLGRQRYGVGKERTPLLEDKSFSESSSKSSKSSKGSKSSSKKDDFIDAESRTEVKDDKPSGGSSKSSKLRFSRKTKVDDVMDGDWRKVEENLKKKTGKTKADDVMDGKWKKVEEPKRNYEAISGALGAGSKFAASSKSSKLRFSRKTKVDDVMDGDWRKVEENLKKKTGKTKADDVMDGKWKKVEEPKRNYEAISGALGAGSKFAASLKSSQERKLQRDKAKVMKPLDLSKFSDAELKSAISRMSSEKTYKQMVADRVDYGREKTIRRLETIGTLAATASSAVGLYAAIKKVRS